MTKVRPFVLESRIGFFFYKSLPRQTTAVKFLKAWTCVVGPLVYPIVGWRWPSTRRYSPTQHVKGLWPEQRVGRCISYC